MSMPARKSQLLSGKSQHYHSGVLNSGIVDVSITA